MNLDALPTWRGCLYSWCRDRLHGTLDSRAHHKAPPHRLELGCGRPIRAETACCRRGLQEGRSKQISPRSGRPSGERRFGNDLTDIESQKKGIEVVNLNDEELSILVKKTFVLIATVGPYCLHGEHALRACALNGTHYLDVTGEYIWVKQMIDKYDASARASGAILIPQSGVESAPADLTTWTVARHVRRTLDSPVKDVTCSVLIEK